MNNSLSIIITLAIYLIIIFAIALKFFPKISLNLYQERGNNKMWIMVMVSIFASLFHLSSDITFLEAIKNDGYSGLWILCSGIFVFGFSPVIFGPFWSRLKLTTENEFCVYRFSGKSSRILQIFRASYLGLIIVPLLASLFILAFEKFSSSLFGYSKSESLGLIFIIFTILTIKNSFKQEIRIHGLNALIQVVSLILIVFFSLSATNYSLPEIWHSLISNQHDLINPIPSNASGKMNNDLWVFVLVQWWSITILDNSNNSAHKYMSIGSSWKTFVAIFLPVLVMLGISFLRSIVFDIYIFTHPNWTENIYESAIDMYIGFVPTALKPIIILGLLVMFIASIENLFNWGCSLINNDLYKCYIKKHENERHYIFSGYVVMYLLLALSSFVSVYQDSFLGVVKFFFSISAGVGPAFIARWFWWRMNAWSQFAAMLSSLIYAVMYDFFIVHSTLFSDFTIWVSSHLDISSFYTKILILTFLVMVTWISTALLTKPVDEKQLKKFYHIVKPGGFWPWATKEDNAILRIKLFWVFLFAVANVSIIIGGWILKYYNLNLGILIVFIAVSIFLTGFFRIKKIFK